MKKITLIKLILVVCSSVLALSFAGCTKDKYAKELLLHLKFDEGSGREVVDSSGNLDNAALNYVFNDPAYQDTPQEAQWRANGAVGGSILFDGYSNFVRYFPEDLSVSGKQFSMAAWVAPRAFEWDAPDAVANNNENLTAIVSQYNEDLGSGFILGFQRHGALSFQVGVDGFFVKVWGSKPLAKYEWNHVAAVFDGDNGAIRLYLNGEIIGEDTVATGSRIAATDDYLYVGRNNSGTSNATATCNMFSGLIDDVRLYKTALPDSYIVSTLYSGGLNNGELKTIVFEDIWLQNILTEDFHKPQYHGGPYQHWMNEPHAPMYYNGKYHLFFQFNLFGPYFRNICWGHLVSDDMVNWRPLKEVITPDKNTVAPDGIWSGGVGYRDDGVPVLFFTAGNDSRTNPDGTNLISNQNIGYAVPKDITDPNLTEWEVSSELVIIQTTGTGRAGDFRDPHLWKEGDTWYMLICSAKTSGGQGGTALLYTSQHPELKSWTYRGAVYEMPNQPSDYGETWELPVILPLSNEAGTISKHIFMISPAPADRADNDIFYWIGTFNKTTYKFVPEHAMPRLLDYGNNVFTGCSGFIDPVQNRAIVFSIMQDQRKPIDQYKSGWAHSVGMAREIWLNSSGSDVKIRAIEEFEDYHGQKLVEMSNKTLSEANGLLTSINGDMLHIRLTVRLNSAESFGIRLRCNPQEFEYTEIFYNNSTSKIAVSTGLGGAQNISGTFDGALELANDQLTMDIFVDRSLIEAFFNESKAISARVYPIDKSSTGLKLVANGNVHVVSMTVWTMNSIY